MMEDTCTAKMASTSAVTVNRCWRLLPFLASFSILFSQSVTAETVYNLIDSDRELSVFTSALKKTALWRGLQSNGPVTVFVPSNEALKNEGSAFLLGKVLISNANKQRLEGVMSYHVYFGMQIVPDDISKMKFTLSDGACLLVYRVGTGIKVGPEAMVTKYIGADNGGIYVIDRLLWRPWAGGNLCGKPARDKPS